MPPLRGSQGRCGKFLLRGALRHTLLEFLCASLLIPALRGLRQKNVYYFHSPPRRDYPGTGPEQPSGLKRLKSGFKIIS
jgi:hypothetical protein